MQARKTTHGLDGQHQDVDRSPRGRVNQNDRGQGVANPRIEDGERTEQNSNVTKIRTEIRTIVY